MLLPNMWTLWCSFMYKRCAHWVSVAFTILASRWTIRAFTILAPRRTMRAFTNLALRPMWCNDYVSFHHLGSEIFIIELFMYHCLFNLCCDFIIKLWTYKSLFNSNTLIVLYTGLIGARDQDQNGKSHNAEKWKETQDYCK